VLLAAAHNFPAAAYFAWVLVVECPR